MKDAVKTQHAQDKPEGTYLSYIVGFVASIVLTLLAFFIVGGHILSGTPLLIALGVLALTQLVVQLVFFLHLSFKPQSRSHLFVFLFMVLIVVIVVFGSIWIMNNLNYNMMSNPEVTEYLDREQGF